MRAQAVAIVLALAAGGAAADLYSWKDASGKLHYSDQPPPHAGARKLTVPPPNTYTGGVPEKPRVAPEEAPQPPRAAQKPAPAPDRQALCEKARADRQTLEETPRRMTSAGGRTRPVDAEERAAKQAQLQKTIDENCR